MQERGRRRWGGEGGGRGREDGKRKGRRRSKGEESEIGPRP